MTNECADNKAKKSIYLWAHVRPEIDASNNLVDIQPDGVGANAAQAAYSQIGLATMFFGRGENLLPSLIGNEVRPAVKYP
jgi:hypothetical protein